MKKIAIFLLLSFCFCHCSEKKQTLDFVTLKKNQFTATPFELPGGGIPDPLLQRAHDSCMGFAFDMNALFIQTRDTFSIGSIVNRRSLKVLNTLTDLGLTQQQIASRFMVITNPCYEKKVLQFPLRSLLGDAFALKLPGAGEALNKEINDAVSASQEADMQTGSWVYLDMRDALQSIIDTTKSATILQYKSNLMDTANMVLASIESVTDVSFLIHTHRAMPAPLLSLLKTKPSVANPRSQASLKLSYIADNQFEMTLNGFFPVAGRFMKAEWK